MSESEFSGNVALFEKEGAEIARMKKTPRRKNGDTARVASGKAGLAGRGALASVLRRPATAEGLRLARNWLVEASLRFRNGPFFLSPPDPTTLEAYVSIGRTTPKVFPDHLQTLGASYSSI